MSDAPRPPFGPEWERIVNEVLGPLREAMQPFARQQQITAQRLAEQLRAATPGFGALKEAMRGLSGSLCWVSTKLAGPRS